MRALIVGVSGPVLLAREAEALGAAEPAGVILFGRNIVDPPQLAALVGSLRAVLPADAVLMVDQEGGRVARLRPPHWRGHPAAAALGAVAERHGLAAGARAAFLSGALIGLDCRRAGFDVVCAPVLDRRVPGAHSVIGDRAFSADPAIVAALGEAMADGLLAAGVQPVGKHAPGHGRAAADSHEALPVVTDDGAEADGAEADLLPFVRNAGLPWMMTAHILFTAWDAYRPATLSAAVIGPILRKRIGFAGLLVSDDLSMRALQGEPLTLMHHALAAGCDVALHCPGEPEVTQAMLQEAPPLTAQAAARLVAARERAATAQRFDAGASDPGADDAAALAAERDRLLA